MATKRRTKSDKLAGEVELAAYMIDNEADYLQDDVVATELTHMSLEFAPGTLPLNIFLHAMAAKLRDHADQIRRLG